MSKMIHQQQNKINDLQVKISDLEAKLAESERKAELYKQAEKKAIHIYSDEFVEKDKELKELRYKVGKANQDKISFAVEQLEQLKKLCQEKFNWWENSEWEGDIYDKSDVSNAYFDIEANVDNQINELKGENK